MIRQAVTEDVSEIRDCAVKAYRRYVSLIGQKPAPMIADFAKQIADGSVYVAADGDGILQGFIVFYPENGSIFLENVAVMPHAAGHGIGKSLIFFCEDQARQLGFNAVTLYTNEKMIENILIYLKLGYVETGRRTEHGFKRIFFEKSLL
ncbi:N-acetyltransferase GCN5 [Acetobacter nitrogenifigens DSM 23921 = NBRC 105050]|uniref:GNAT family N-acetyltransferase n=1 Tax=Acetobacter nitrogenifigens DSM 23921 = NBRC 105050 TaxID=1120919 RepID=A0A511XEM7_9PROT|nr:GNAT family N-acetyltransferase [Acetobacter nitrogenifigens]GBQ96572.1 N-acetyltransferase GCN5 [Acetobacter nitrogenifigens DSM 23921 = NBRC 105050]GEN61419.1 GNAT family N-acetyltransferase [Acetobacter nitrogenifigens DSM 23921 = NBRC 105050]